MGLFRQKQPMEDEDERCPNCRERLPESATTCMMCGLPLEPVRDASGEPGAKRRVQDSDSPRRLPHAR